MRLPLQFEIDDQSRIAQCRRRVKAMARTLKFSEVDRERVGIAVTEAVTNVLRHAGRGRFLAQRMEGPQGPFLIVLVWDEGPGISNYSRCLEDGYSSAGGQGIGLGAMRRQSDAFEMYSKPKGGLVVSMTFWKRCKSTAELPESGAFRNLFASALPMPGEVESGDAWAVAEVSGVFKILLVDGLGHGTKAAKASSLALNCFKDVAGDPGDSIVKSLNEAMRGSRGAVVAVAEIDPSAEQLRYTGIGNIFGRLLVDGITSQLTSTSGIVGYQMGKVQSFEYDWKKDSMVVLHSDGIGSKWSLSSYPGLGYCQSSTVAGTLLSDYRKYSDDSSIVVLSSRDPVVMGGEG